MMSQYGLPYEYDDSCLCGALELSIETLTGAAFEIRVSPNDTIMSIKSKIQRVEGIPVSQQHLLYNLEELENSASIQDYSIQNGATLKLVLSMRGGPISTRRLPPVDEMAWRELQELMLDGKRDELFEKLPSGSKVTVLVFRDGDQVNLFRVVENEDGTYSPLSESWSGTSIRNLFAEEDPEESAKRLQENSVTMGKMQELKEKLESLSIHRKEKKGEEVVTEEAAAKEEEREVREEREEASWRPRDPRLGFGDGGQAVGGAGRRAQLPELDRVALGKASMTGLSKARKEAENIIRMQSNLLVEAGHAFRVKRTPLPEIRRSPDHKEDERQKTNRLPASSFAIVEEENEVGPAPGMCPSQRSFLASDDVAIAFSPMPRATTVGRSRYCVSRYVLDSDQRPKTTPGKMTESRRQSRPLCNLVAEEPQSRNRTKHILSTLSSMDLLQEARPPGEDPGARSQLRRRGSVLRNLHPSYREEPVVAVPPATQKLQPPTTKKKSRCLQCRKKLNITNKHTCRCGSTFCSSHRYSEVHNCPFDYKEEGKKLLQQANPLVAASKLPKI